MGIADLIPGISGGTVAFVSGIYDEWLDSIKSLQVHNFRQIAWPFLSAVGGGILTALFLLSKVICFLLLHYKAPLFGLFFGMIGASVFLFLSGKHDAFQSDQKMIRGKGDAVILLGAFALSFGLTLLPNLHFFESSLWGIAIAGMFAIAAMLLPGISGSFILQVLGVYPIVIQSLANPTAPGSLKVLIAIAMGISLGLILFSRVISFVLKYFRRLILLLLTGFMAGGLKALWPFDGSSYLFPSLFLVVGFFSIIVLEISLKHLKNSKLNPTVLN